MHIHHLAIRVSNLQKSIAFYERLTGLQIIERFKADSGEVAYMANGEGETQIELICMPDDQRLETQGMFLCFATDALDAAHARAKSENMNPSAIRSPDPDTRYFYVYDPDGMSVQLRQYP